MSKQDTARQAMWRQLIAEHEQSGLSQKQFCDERGIADSTMSTYRAKFKKENNKTPPASPSVTPIELQSSPKKPIVKKDSLMITLPNGFTCEIKPDADLAYLKRLVGVLLSC